MNTTDLEPEEKPQQPRAKWESEIEEILAASDRDSTAVEKARGKMTVARLQAPGQWQRLRTSVANRGSTGFWILVFLSLVIGAFAVRYFSPLLGRTLALAAIALLVIVVVRGLFRPSSPPESSRMWRGRDLGPNPSEQSWRSRLFDREPRE